MPKFKQKALAIDTETTGIDFHHGTKPFFVTCCDEEGEITYWETLIDPLTRQPKWSSKDIAEISKFISEYDVWVFQNAKFDIRALSTIGVQLPDNLWDRVKDTLTASHLLCSNQPHDLVTLAMIYLRANIQPLSDALEVAVKSAYKIVKKEYPKWMIAKAGMSEIPSAKGSTWSYDSWLPRAVAQAEDYDSDHDWWSVLAEYSNADSSVTIALYQKMESLLLKGKLWPIYLESMKLLPSIYRMESAGMTMSRTRKDELYKRLTTEAEECRQTCIELSDGEIEDLPVNGMSNALRYVLFEKFGLKSNKKTKKGKQSGDKFVLDHWLATLPETSRPWKFVNAIRRYRKRKTAIGYMDSYEKFWLPLERDTALWKRGSRPTNASPWRIVYPSYNHTGTDTLRFTSQNPNAQQVSKQEEVNLRYCFGPAPDREWWAIDFSNLELRIPAYEAQEEEMVYLFEHPDDPPYFGSYHLLVFDTLHPDKFAKHGKDCKDVFADTWYQWTKNGNFAVQYGAVEKSGTADKAYHVPGAQRRIMSRFARIKKLSRKWIDFANDCGYVETMPDKWVDPSRGYPLYCTRTDYNKVLETVPLSYHVQGTAMWITRKAMVRCDEYLSHYKSVDGHMIAQVHDEILFDFPKGKGRDHIEELARLMRQSGDDVGVPLEVTVHYHPVSWAKAEKENYSAAV